MPPTHMKHIVIGTAALAALSLTGCHQDDPTVPTVAEQQEANAKEKAKEDARLTPEQKATAAKADAAANAGVRAEH